MVATKLRSSQMQKYIFRISNRIDLTTNNCAVELMLNICSVTQYLRSSRSHEQ